MMTPSIGNGVSLSSALREIGPVGEVRDREEREKRRAEKFETEAPPPRDEPPRRPPEPQIDDRRRAEAEPRERAAPRDVIDIDTVGGQPEPRQVERREPESAETREVSPAPVARPVDARPTADVTTVEEFPPPRTTPADGELRDINSRPQLSGDTLLFLTTARFPVPNLVVDQHRATAAYQQAQAASAQASVARVAFADTADQQVRA